MAELSTLARPYAKAAFEVARQESDLDSWSSMLGTSAAVAGQESVRAMLTDPSLSTERVAGAFIDILGESVGAKGQNFIRLLAENKRLVLLKANQEKSVDVEITTAFEVSSEISDKLANALKDRLQREIRLATSVDKTLIGGAVIRAGDTVIDSSVRGKLKKLAEAMNS
jgi:F-type H+-transporting ATPase subunit delta